MAQYRRWRHGGASYFFTVTLQDRRRFLLVEHTGLLRAAVKAVRERHPFEILAMVVLPDHLHTIWTLPKGDDNYPMRWRQIKSAFTRPLPRDSIVTPARERRGERDIWQRRYWEHLIRDGQDLRIHIDYIHYNPVKHGHVRKPIDWPYSSLHRYVRRDELPATWGTAGLDVDLDLD